MKTLMLINIDSVENRTAVTVDGRLERLAVESARDTRNRGNIFKGVIKKVEPSLQAAFVDYGADRDGFLPLDEIHPHLFPKGVDAKAPLQKVLKNRQSVLVQVAKDEVGTKGAALTTYVSLAGRFLVLMPESDRTGISRKLSDEERGRLREVLAEVKLPKGFGVIVRTAASSLTKADATKDLSYLTRLWNGVVRRFDEMKGPGLIYEEANLAIRFVRDYFTTDIDEVWVDDEAAWQELQDFMAVLMPRNVQKVRLYQGEEPLFSHFGVEEQIDLVFDRTVPLPSGGSIVIDETEALVAIDVNSGRTKEKNADETILQTNLEAVEEIARQAMLRDLGGLIVLDLIDMREASHRRKVELALRAAFKRDKARLRFGRISTFGLLELSRQRLKTSLWSKSFGTCPHCEGSGAIRSDESAAVQALRKLKALATKAKVEYIRAELPTGLAHYLLNERRRELAALEEKTRTRIEIFDDPSIFSQNVRFVMHEPSDKEKRLPQKPVVDVYGRDPVRSEPSRRSSPAFSMYDERLVDRDASAVDDLEEPVAPSTPVAPPSPAPAPPTAPRETAPPTAPVAQGVGRVSPSLEDDTRPFRWLRKLFGANAEEGSFAASAPSFVPSPSPAVKAPSPAAPGTSAVVPRTIVVPAAREEAPADAEGAARPENEAARPEGEAARKRRRGGRGRARSAEAPGTKAAKPAEVQEKTAVATSPPAKAPKEPKADKPAKGAVATAKGAEDEDAKRSRTSGAARRRARKRKTANGEATDGAEGAQKD